MADRDPPPGAPSEAPRLPPPEELPTTPSPAHQALHAHVTARSGASTEPESTDRKSRILHAAQHLFSEKGFEATSIRDIALGSGTNSALIYYYFGDKENLLAACIQEPAEKIATLLREALEQAGTVRERLEAFVSAWVEFIFPRCVFAPLLRRTIDSDTPIGAHLRLRMRTNLDRMAQLIEQGIASGELRAANPHLAAVSIMGTIFVLIVGYPVAREIAGISLESDQERREAVHQLVDNWYRGLAA